VGLEGNLLPHGSNGAAIRGGRRTLGLRCMQSPLVGLFPKKNESRFCRNGHASAIENSRTICPYLNTNLSGSGFLADLSRERGKGFFPLLLSGFPISISKTRSSADRHFRLERDMQPKRTYDGV